MSRQPSYPPSRPVTATQQTRSSFLDDNDDNVFFSSSTSAHSIDIGNRDGSNDTSAVLTRPLSSSRHSSRPMSAIDSTSSSSALNPPMSLKPSQAHISPINMSSTRPRSQSGPRTSADPSSQNQGEASRSTSGGKSNTLHRTVSPVPPAPLDSHARQPFRLCSGAVMLPTFAVHLISFTSQLIFLLLIDRLWHEGDYKLLHPMWTASSR